MAAYPIWATTSYQAPSSASPMNYSISLDGDIIFNGKAWARPVSSISTASATMEINLNTICQDYLSSELPDLRNVKGTATYVHPHAVHRFILMNEDKNTVLGRYDFVLDWSYTFSNYTTGSVRMSHPINGRWVPGMLTFDTMYTVRDNPSAGEPDISAVTTTISPQVQTGYTEVDVCHADFALYYLNRYGGWDSFLIEGNVTAKDAYTRYNIISPYDNTTLQFGKRTYNNQIQPSWELHTGWLKDDESERLAFNLLPSNMMYLHNLKEDTIIPVTVDDSSVDYRTFRNQGRKLFTYTINISASQTQANLG